MLPHMGVPSAIEKKLYMCVDGVLGLDKVQAQQANFGIGICPQ